MLPDTTVSDADAKAPVQVTGDVAMAEAVTVKKMPILMMKCPNLQRLRLFVRSPDLRR